MHGAASRMCMMEVHTLAKLSILSVHLYKLQNIYSYTNMYSGIYKSGNMTIKYTKYATINIDSCDIYICVRFDYIGWLIR